MQGPRYSTAPSGMWRRAGFPTPQSAATRECEPLPGSVDAPRVLGEHHLRGLVCLILVIDPGPDERRERFLQDLPPYLGAGPVDLGDDDAVGAEDDPRRRGHIEDLRGLLYRARDAREGYHLGEVDVDVLQGVRVECRLL